MPETSCCEQQVIKCLTFVISGVALLNIHITRYDSKSSMYKLLVMFLPVQLKGVIHSARRICWSMG